MEVDIVAIDEMPEETAPSLNEELKLKSQSSTGGLANCLTLKKVNMLC